MSRPRSANEANSKNDYLDNLQIEAIKEQVKQVEELKRNLIDVNKVSIQNLVENKLETKQWLTLFKNKVEHHRCWKVAGLSDRHENQDGNKQ